MFLKNPTCKLMIVTHERVMAVVLGMKHRYQENIKKKIPSQPRYFNGSKTGDQRSDINEVIWGCNLEVKGC